MVVLDHLETICGAHLNQDNFDPQNPHQTAYNLGKNRIYRHIKSMIEAEITETKDCITMEKTNE